MKGFPARVMTVMLGLAVQLDGSVLLREPSRFYTGTNRTGVLI